MLIWYVIKYISDQLAIYVLVNVFKSGISIFNKQQECLELSYSYKLIKSNFSYEPYLNLPSYLRIPLTKVKIGCHSLAVEIGKHHNPTVTKFSYAVHFSKQQMLINARMKLKCI